MTLNKAKFVSLICRAVSVLYIFVLSTSFAYNQEPTDDIKAPQTSLGPSTKTSTKLSNLFKDNLNNMVLIEGGTFLMGSNDSKAYDFEKPVHQQDITSFYLSKTEVSQALWTEVMGWNYSYFPCDSCPVNNISWVNIALFIKRLNRQTNSQFRLPTEAEWEYAAKGGNKSKNYQFSGSNTIGDVAWYVGNAEGKIHPVATRMANELGLYDMTGNVWEFCQDDMSKQAYSSTKKSGEAFDLGAPNNTQTLKVVRGSGYEFNAEESYVYRRDGASSNVRLPDVGFRLAATKLN